MAYHSLIRILGKCANAIGSWVNTWYIYSLVPIRCYTTTIKVQVWVENLHDHCRFWIMFSTPRAHGCSLYTTSSHAFVQKIPIQYIFYWNKTSWDNGFRFPRGPPRYYPHECQRCLSQSLWLPARTSNSLQVGSAEGMRVWDWCEAAQKGMKEESVGEYRLILYRHR